MKLTLSLVFMLATSMYASTVNLSIATDPAQYSTLHADEQLAPVEDSADRLFYHHAVYTDGPVRNGYLQIQTGGYGGFVTLAEGQLDLGFAGGPINGIDVEASCGPQGCLPGNGYYGYYNRIPVTLGAPMTLEAVGYMFYYYNGVLAYYTGGGMDGIFQFRFFEADGVTPVAVSDAPEPSTWGLIGLSLAGVGLLRRKLA